MIAQSIQRCGNRFELVRSHTNPNDNNRDSGKSPEVQKKIRVRELEEELARWISSESGTNLEAV